MNGAACELWGGFQSQTINQAAVAKILGLSPDDISLHTIFAGGSFGRRASFTSDWVVEVAEILKATGGQWPIKLMRSREDDMTGGYYRPLFVHHYRFGVDAAGHITGMEMKLVGQSIVADPPYGEKAPQQAEFLAYMGNFVERYAVDDASVHWVSPKVRVPVHTFRSIGNTHTTMSKEIMIDRLARRANIDPIEYRLAYLAKAPRQAMVLRLAAEKCGWGRKHLPHGHALGMAVQESENSFIAQIAQVSIENGQIKVHHVTCAVDCGLVLNPDNVRAQIEGGIGFGLNTALHSAITMTDGVVDQQNFDTYPLLRMNEMPRVEVHIVKSSAKPTGVGEPGSTPIGPAVANAVERLTGKQFTEFPLTRMALT
jgi:isoquinoline 1-oxidoreductase beta subunit